MKPFISFFTEATLAGSGFNAERHTKYIKPAIDTGEAHEAGIAKNHDYIKADSPVHIHSYHVDDKGKYHAVMSQNGGAKVAVPFSKIKKSRQQVKYSDEHAHANIWNHMTDLGIAHDKEAMLHEHHKMLTDPNHPLHFDRASSEGFEGHKKTEKHKANYYQEHLHAISTVHEMAQHPHFHQAVKDKHVARVMGASLGKLTDLYKEHGVRGFGATSKSDIAVMPRTGHGKGLRLSMKKGDAQLMSSGPQENAAIHDHATRMLLKHHPAYASKSQGEKDEIHKSIMDRIQKVREHALAAKGVHDDAALKSHIFAGQKYLNDVHNEHPALNNFVRREATTGEGKFGEHSEHAATYLVSSGTDKGNTKVKVQHAGEANYDGPRPYLSKAKNPGGPLAVRASHKAERIPKPPKPPKPIKPPKEKKVPAPRPSRAKVKAV